jgi:hypothetical protein
LLVNNKFVKVFYSAGERLRAEPSLELRIVIRSDTVSDKKRYNKPNENEVAKLLAGQADAELKRDVKVALLSVWMYCMVLMTHFNMYYCSIWSIWME